MRDSKPKPKPNSKAATRGEEKGKTRDEIKVPHDPVNEVVLIAAVVVSRKAAEKYLPAIPADHFHAKGHALMWGVLQEMHARGLTYDPATAKQMSGGAFDTVLLEEYVTARPEEPPNLRYHVQRLHWDHARVEAVEGPVQGLLEALRDPTTSEERVRGLARQVGRAFEGHGTAGHLRGTEELLTETDKRLSLRREGIACFPYGITALDFYGDNDEDSEHRPLAGQPRLLPGAAPGKITIVTGVTGSGKSTSVKRMVLGLVNQGRKVCYGAWEEGDSPTIETLAAMSLGWSRTDLIAGNYTEQHQRELYQEMERLLAHVRFFRLPNNRKNNTLERGHLDLIMNVVADSGADVFVGDLLKRAFGNVQPDEEAQFLYELQDWAERMRIHQLWLHQQRFKDVEQRRDKRPTREAVKGIGEWVEVSDTLIGWHREALWKNVPDNRIESIVLKQRWGPWPMSVEFEYDAEYGYIGNGWSVTYDRPGVDAVDDDIFSEREGSAAGRKGKRR